MAKQCCERDHNHDGNCDRHPAIFCKNTTYIHACHSVYAQRYNGYCLDCFNAGIPDLVSELARARKKIEALVFAGNNMAADLEHRGCKNPALQCDLCNWEKAKEMP